MHVPLCKPDISALELDAVRQVLLSGNLSHGQEVAAFEQSFAELTQCSDAIAFSSWTTAAFLVFKYIAEMTGGGEVIMPSYTFSASANAAKTAGLVPRFAEVEWESHEVTAATIEPLISSSTVAIMPVHFAGKVCDMKPITELAEEYALPIIEDSAETLGASCDNKPAGSFGVGIFSFYATKNITTGEGGMVTTNDKDLAEWLRIRMAHGIKKGSYGTSPWHRNAVAPGYNFRLGNMNAALGNAQLSRLTELNAKRNQVAQHYQSELKDVISIDLPPLLPQEQHSYQMYVIKVSDRIRDDIVSMLNDAGVGASVHFDPPVHMQTAYATGEDVLPITEHLAASSISLPISPVQTERETQYVVDTLLGLLRG